MAVTWSFGTKLYASVWGDRRVFIGTMTSSGTYSDGGDSFSPGTVSNGWINTPDMVIPIGPAVPSDFSEGAIPHIWRHSETRVWSVAFFSGTGAASHTHTVDVSAHDHDVTVANESAHTHTTPAHTHDFTTDAGGEVVTAHAHDFKLVAGVVEDEGVGIETTGGPIIGTTTGQTVLGADSETKGGVLSGGEIVTEHTHTGTTDSDGSGTSGAGVAHTHTATAGNAEATGGEGAASFTTSAGGDAGFAAMVQVTAGADMSGLGVTFLMIGVE